MSRTRPAGPPLSPIDKQFFFQVKYGRKVTFFPHDNDEVTGYLAGWDRYSWFVLEPCADRVRQKIVHKNCPVVELHPEATLNTEPPHIQEQLRAIIDRFRSKLMDEYGGSTPPRKNAETEERPR